MLLTTDQFWEQAKALHNLPGGEVGVDFETDGLWPFKGHRAHILGFTDDAGFRYCVRVAPPNTDEGMNFLRAMHLFFANEKLTYCAHNAKFEMGFLFEQFGVEVRGRVWDTEVMARMEHNNHLSYGLQACAERLGETKYPPMLDWLKVRGNKARHVYAPPELLIPYVEQDAWLSWRLRKHQVEVFTHWDTSSPSKIKPAVKLESAVLRPLFEMEKAGLLLDVGYCKRAIEYERQVIERAKADFEKQTSVSFVDSRKTLQPVFEAHGIRYARTALGNASFTEEALVGDRGHPVVAAILAHRRAVKRVSAYWENFLALEQNGIIHPSIHQNKAQTGRMSISDPSAQNWSTDEDDGTRFPIRRAFIARPDCLIVSLDYSQMELRKAADEAEDLPMIERIQSGADLHQEIADMAGVSRALAKNGRFAKQYGAGIPRIAATLGVSEGVARSISTALDQQAAGVASYSRYLQKTAWPFSTDWLGRRFYFDSGYEYKAFNYRIQGGCAEILKIAICDVAAFLAARARPETFLLLPIHDEIVINLHESDKSLLPEIKRLMVAAHRDKKTLAMDVGVAIGPNFHDLEKVNL